MVQAATNVWCVDSTARLKTEALEHLFSVISVCCIQMALMQPVLNTISVGLSSSDLWNYMIEKWEKGRGINISAENVRAQ